MRQLQEPYVEALQGCEAFLVGIARDRFAASIAFALNTAVGQVCESMQGGNQQSQQLGGTVHALNGEARNALQSVALRCLAVYLRCSALTLRAACRRLFAELPRAGRPCRIF